MSEVAAIPESEMRVFLDLEIARLDELTRPTWKKYKVKLQEIPFENDGRRGVMFFVAKDEEQVIVFDAAAGEFGLGFVDEDGVVRNWTNYGESLGATLRHFPRHRK